MANFQFMPILTLKLSVFRTKCPMAWLEFPGFLNPESQKSDSPESWNPLLAKKPGKKGTRPREGWQRKVRNEGEEPGEGEDLLRTA
jgi:hypothetical protein